MDNPFNHEDLAKLRAFLGFVSGNPTILNFPQLDFVKSFIEKFGGKVPPGEFKMPSGGKCPFGGAAAGKANTASKPPEEDSESEKEEFPSEPESDLDLDMEGVIEADGDVNQPMGDSSKIPTEEEGDKASEIRSKAAGAYAEQKFQHAIDLYTQAIELNPGNALFHAKRGQAFLKLKKPNACIRDCNKALELNCDSAAAYKFRGRAHRLLGNWEAAANDLRQACKLDFDEEADEWLREVTPNAKKIEQHRIKQERKKIERSGKTQKGSANRKTRKQQKQKQKQNEGKTSAGGAGPGAGAGAGAGAFPGGPLPTGGFPAGFPAGFGGGPGVADDIEGAAETGGAGGNSFDFMEWLTDIQNPETIAVLADIAYNSGDIEKHKANPKLGKLFDGMKHFTNQFPGFNCGLPQGFQFPTAPEADNGDTADANPASNTTSEAKTQPKKPDFVDDGLD